VKNRVLVDLKIEVDAPSVPSWLANTPERREKYLQEWCRDFNDFVRDHRSQDPVTLSVVREYEDQCSYCHNEWELDGDGFPACCNKAQEEHQASLDKAHA
jgi:hypothetical protein